jgi:4-hydroxybenzoate polyprenyltransferase
MTGPTAEALPDTTGHWALRLAPKPWRGYIQLARFDRPIGWQLLLLPCCWSVALAAKAAGAAPNLLHLVLLALGAIAMRGAGSTFNDIVDRDLDRQVARTRERPIASGRVSRRHAALFLLAQALVGLGVVLCFNRFTVALSCASLLIVAAYPFAKRVTSWPQAVLGLAFAWGALVGWAATFGSLAAAPVWLYVAAILWTIGYDTIYALQDRTDDALVGIGSTALYFGDHVRSGVAVLYGLTAVAAAIALHLAGAGWAAGCGWAVFSAHLGWQVVRIAPTVPGRSQMLFRSNRIAGLMLFAGIAADALLAR